jgi:hypothetical protein
MPAARYLCARGGMVPPRGHGAPNRIRQIPVKETRK